MLNNNENKMMMTRWDSYLAIVKAGPSPHVINGPVEIEHVVLLLKAGVKVKVTKSC